MSESLDAFALYVEGMEKPFWEPIGRYVFKFGMLERRVDIELSTLMGIAYANVGQYALNDMDFLSRVHLLRVFSRRTSQDKEMKQFIQDLEAQNTFRNNVVHGPWTAFHSSIDGSGNPGRSGWQKIGLSRKHHPKAFNVTVADLITNASEVERLGICLVGIVREIKSEK